MAFQNSHCDACTQVGIHSSKHLLQAYSNNLVDHHIILDLLPSLAQAYFSQHVPVNLSYLQAAILLSLGLQQNDISTLEAAIQLPANQALALFNKVRDFTCTIAYLEMVVG